MAGGVMKGVEDRLTPSVSTCREHGHALARTWMPDAVITPLGALEPAAAAAAARCTCST